MNKLSETFKTKIGSRSGSKRSDLLIDFEKKLSAETVQSSLNGKERKIPVVSFLTPSVTKDFSTPAFDTHLRLPAPKEGR